MIFYFTATGNCLYVAKKIEKNLISIPQIIHQDDLEFEDETIGIVAPIYAGEIPNIVKEFIKKATLKSPYVYILLTYGMNDSVAAKWTYEYALENGINIDYIATIQMVDNYLPSFDMLEQMAMDKHIDEQLSRVLLDLSQRKKGYNEPTQKGKEAYAMVQKRFLEHPELNNGESLYVTDQCIGCGICAKVCPIGNIDMINGKANRKQKTCEFCLACIQNCPHKAIALKYADKNPQARYRHAEISLKDIIEANNQNK